MSKKIPSCLEDNLILGTGLSSAKTFDELLVLIKKSISCGIFSIDTAPSYGVESVIGTVLKELISSGFIKRDDLFIQDKVDAWQMQEGSGNVEKYVLDSLAKMSLDYFDSVLIHWPVPEYRDDTMKCLFALKQKGLIKHIGICNVRMRQLYQMEKMGIMPDIVQIERNPLRICLEESDFCKIHGIILQSYSPLCKFCDDIKNSEILSELAQKYKKSIGQIVMRWHLDTGVVPVFTTKKTERINEYTEIGNFKLSETDINSINSMNKNYKMYLESFACPGF